MTNFVRKVVVMFGDIFLITHLIVIIITIMITLIIRHKHLIQVFQLVGSLGLLLDRLLQPLY